jgi:hypothetical protein
MEFNRRPDNYSEAPREELVQVRELLEDMFDEHPDCTTVESFPATPNTLQAIKETLLYKTSDGRYVISRIIADGYPAIFTINLYDLENICRLDNDTGGNDVKLIQYNFYSNTRAIYRCNTRGRLPVIHEDTRELDTKGVNIVFEFLTEEFAEVASRDELRLLLLLQQKADDLERTHGHLPIIEP